MAVTILAAGDLHLGRRSKHLPADVSREVSSPMYTWRRLVDEAVRREVDLFCLTGDIVDQDNKYFEAFGPLLQGFRALSEHQIPTYLVAGNHDFDVLSGLVDQIDSDSVHLLGRHGSWEERTFEHPDLPLTITGWSFPETHYRRNPLEDFAGDGLSDRLAIGLLHCDLDTAGSKYAPVASSDLANTPVDCWLLGHIHKPALFLGEPHVLYPGSPHALDNGEQGVHGAWLVTVHSAHRIETRQLPLSPVRYESISVDVGSVGSREEWRSAIVSAIEEYVDSRAEELEPTDLLMCDVELDGRTDQYEAVTRWIDDPDIRELSYRSDDTTARIYKIRNATRPAIGNLERLAAQENPAGYLARVIRAVEEERESALVDELVEALRPVFRRVDTSSTYSPLRASAPLEHSERAIKEQVLDRSRELLAALVEQKDQTG